MWSESVCFILFLIKIWLHHFPLPLLLPTLPILPSPPYPPNLWSFSSSLLHIWVQPAQSVWCFLCQNHIWHAAFRSVSSIPLQMEVVVIVLKKNISDPWHDLKTHLCPFLYCRMFMLSLYLGYCGQCYYQHTSEDNVSRFFLWQYIPQSRIVGSSFL